ncbi:TetR/AcrR family transcriptional regulator [Dactylosporangium darangshiense]|uniref:TetR/AcrR family transcriptional regulator n=1 Tax=Dactylosporangium darangshiense TaxID=579108 RepID=A0ABP8DUL6_9ACTN
MTIKRPSARERLLAAADELFYAEGVHSVGIDRVIEHAGVAKGTLYNTFGSKDELVLAYVERRHQLRAGRVEKHIAGIEDPRERLLGVFDVLGDVFAMPDFRGCAFLNASVEAPIAGVVKDRCDASRTWVRDLFTDLARDAGARDPELMAHQLVMLYDGATVSAQLDRAPNAALLARTVAAGLLDGATSGQARRA